MADRRARSSHHAKGGNEEDFNLAAPPEHVLRECAHFVERAAARLGQTPQRRDVGLSRRTVGRVGRLLHVALALEVLQHARQAGLQRGSSRPLLCQPPHLHLTSFVSRAYSFSLCWNEERWAACSQTSYFTFF